MKGYHTTVFAYGQTCSGKTHTMLGSANEPGLIPLIVAYVHDRLEGMQGWKLSVSYLEIYNESVNDLIDPSKKNLDVRENRSREIYIEGLSQVEVKTQAQTMDLLHKGEEQRIIAETRLNQQSSRSHTVFRLDLEYLDSDGLTQAVRSSQINLVDLAGSEGVSRTRN